MPDQTMEWLAIGWLCALIGCAVALRLKHHTLPRLALCALIWPAIAWLALCEWADRTKQPGESP